MKKDRATYEDILEIQLTMTDLTIYFLATVGQNTGTKIQTFLPGISRSTIYKSISKMIDFGIISENKGIFIPNIDRFIDIAQQQATKIWGDTNGFARIPYPLIGRALSQEDLSKKILEHIPKELDELRTDVRKNAVKIHTAGLLVLNNPETLKEVLVGFAYALISHTPVTGKMRATIAEWIEYIWITLGRGIFWIGDAPERLKQIIYGAVQRMQKDFEEYGINPDPIIGTYLVITYLKILGMWNSFLAEPYQQMWSIFSTDIVNGLA